MKKEDLNKYKEEAFKGNPANLLEYYNTFGGEWVDNSYWKIDKTHSLEQVNGEWVVREWEHSSYFRN